MTLFPRINMINALHCLLFCAKAKLNRSSSTTKYNISFELNDIMDMRDAGPKLSQHGLDVLCLLGVPVGVRLYTDPWPGDPGGGLYLEGRLR